MTGLGSRMHDCVGNKLLNQFEHTRSIPDVQFMVSEARQLLFQTSLVPSGVTLLPKKHRALVVIHALDPPSVLMEIRAYFRPNKS